MMFLSNETRDQLILHRQVAQAVYESDTCGSRASVYLIRRRF